MTSFFLVIYIANVRFSHAGRVCSGDYNYMYLENANQGKLYGKGVRHHVVTKYEPLYLREEGIILRNVCVGLAYAYFGCLCCIFGCYTCFLFFGARFAEENTYANIASHDWEKTIEAFQKA